MTSSEDRRAQRILDYPHEIAQATGAGTQAPNVLAEVDKYYKIVELETRLDKKEESMASLRSSNAKLEADLAAVKEDHAAMKERLDRMEACIILVAQAGSVSLFTIPKSSCDERIKDYLQI